MKMEITELNTGKKHYRTIKKNVSCEYRVEGNYLVVRDYYTREVISKFNVSKYGSISFRAI